MDFSQRKSIILCLILVIVQGFSLWGIISRGNHDFVGNIIGSSLFWIAYTLFEYNYKLKISYYIRLGVVIAIIGDGFLGFYLNFYVTSPAFDRIQHIFSTYIFSLFFYAILMHFKHEPIEMKWIRFIFIAAIGMAIGSINEIIEFTADTIMKTQIPNQPSLQDTDMDLISNMVGAFIAGFHSLYNSFGNK